MEHKSNPIEISFNLNAETLTTSNGVFGFTLSKGYSVRDITVKKVRHYLDNTQFSFTDLSGANLICEFKSLASQGGADQIVSAKSSYFFSPNVALSHHFPLCEITQLDNLNKDIIVNDNIEHILLHKRNGADLFGPYIQFTVGQVITPIATPPAVPTSEFLTSILTPTAIESGEGFIEITLEINLAVGEVWNN